jgi:hypothetical protein
MTGSWYDHQTAILGNGGVVKTIRFPTGLSAIDAGACKQHVSLESVILPPYCSIGNAAFADCTALVSVLVASGDASLPQVGPGFIGEQAFKGCTSLSTFHIPLNCAEIRARAFDGCRSLTSITIPVGCNVAADFADPGVRVIRV